MANPTQSISNAISAYVDAARAATQGERAELGTSDAGAKETFADLVKGALNQSVDNGKAGESLSLSAVRDEADLNNVITAVAEAELTLETVVAVRDKMIDAYKEILRMPM